MTDVQTKAPTASRVAILLAVYLLTIAPNIGTRDLWEPEELRYAEVASEMAQSADWALLRINGKIYPDKPPLFFWLICASTKCFGGLNAVTVRVPNIGSALLLLLLIYFFGRRLVGDRAAFLAGLVLMAMPYFVWTCAEARMDTTLTLFIALALCCFWRNYENGGRSIPLHLAFGILTGLAILTKGPIGFLIPFLIALVFAIKEKQRQRLLNRTFLAAIIAALAVVLPWLITACVRGGSEFTGNLLFTQNVGRAVLGIRHSEPFYHFFKVVPGLLLPWTLLLPAMLYLPFTETDRERRRGRMFVLCWFLTVFVFFTLSKGKRTIYMTPLLPAAGLLLGSVLDGFLSAESADRPRRGTRFAIGVTAVSLLVFSLAAPLFISLLRGPLHRSSVLTKLIGHAMDSYPDYLSLAVIVASAAAAGSLAAVILFFLRRRALCLFVLMGAISLSWFIASILILPAVNHEKSARILLDHLARIVDRQKSPLSIFHSERLGYAVYWGEPIPVLDTFEELLDYLSSSERVFCLGRREQFPLSLANGYLIWRDSCGYREHVLVSNQIKNVPKELLREFQRQHMDAGILELPRLTLLASGGEPSVADDVDIEIESTSDTVLLKFFPGQRDAVQPITFRVRGMSADHVEILTHPLAADRTPVECQPEPYSSPLTASLYLRNPCAILVKKHNPSGSSSPIQGN